MKTEDDHVLARLKGLATQQPAPGKKVYTRWLPAAAGAEGSWSAEPGTVRNIKALNAAMAAAGDSECLGMVKTLLHWWVNNRDYEDRLREIFARCAEFASWGMLVTLSINNGTGSLEFWYGVPRQFCSNTVAEGGGGLLLGIYGAEGDVKKWVDALAPGLWTSGIRTSVGVTLLLPG